MPAEFVDLINLFSTNEFPEQIVLSRDYLGVFDSGLRVLLFVFRPDGTEGSLYLSGNWQSRYPVKRGGLPDALPLTTTEARWILSCWSALHIRTTGMPSRLLAASSDTLCVFCAGMFG